MFQGSEPSKRICEAEVDNFFAEIDALGTGPLLSKPNGAADIKHPPIAPPAPSESPPPPPAPPSSDPSTIPVNCHWTEYVDPQTEFVYYYNATTQETTWDMPEEYRSKKELHGTEESSQHSKTQSKNSGNAEGEIEYLQEYVANSESTDSSNESSSSAGAKVKPTDNIPTRTEKERKHYKGSRKRKKPRTKDEESVHKKKKRKQKKAKTDNVEEVLIGPQLPVGRSEDEVKDELSDEEGSPKLVNSEIGPQLPNNLKVDEDGDGDGETKPTRFIGPRLPSLDEDGCEKDETELKSKSQENDSSQFQEAQEELSETIRQQNSMLLSKLQFLNVNMDSLPLLSILLIRLETRYSDWSCGALSLERMVSTLNEAIVEMADYESSAVPDGWKCFWDSSTDRYYYENQITSDCQWEYPTEPVTDTTTAAVLSPAVEETSSSNLQAQELEDKEPVQQEAAEAPTVASPVPLKEGVESADDGQSREGSVSIVNETYDDSCDETPDESETHSHVTLEDIVCTEEASSSVEPVHPPESSLQEAGDVESDENIVSPVEESVPVDVKEVSVNGDNSTSSQQLPPPPPPPPPPPAPVMEVLEETAAPPPVPIEEKPVAVKPLRLVAYDDDEDSDSQSDDDESSYDIGSRVKLVSSDRSNSPYLPQACRTGPESVDRGPTGTQPSVSSVVSASSNQSSPVIPHEPSPCLDGDDMEVDSDNEQELPTAIVLNVPPVPPPPPPPLPLLPARPPTPPPPPPPPPHRPVLTSVPPQPKSQVIIETPPTSVVVEVSAPEPNLPSTSELIDEFDDDQSSPAAATKRKKQKPAKNKIGLKGMQNLFQKWQQVQENL